MLLLIAEIGLTISAWRKGWTWRALIPSLALMGGAFLLGAYCGLHGIPEYKFLPWGVALELTNVVVLAVMSRRVPARLRDVGARQATQVAPAATPQESFRTLNRALVGNGAGSAGL